MKTTAKPTADFWPAQLAGIFEQIVRTGGGFPAETIELLECPGMNFKPELRRAVTAVMPFLAQCVREQVVLTLSQNQKMRYEDTPHGLEIIRRVSCINRQVDPRVAIKAAGLDSSLVAKAVDSMPLNRLGPEAVELVYFYVPERASVLQVERQYQDHSLVPDLLAQLADNGRDPGFVTTYRNSAQWRVGGRYCYASFFMMGSQPTVHIKSGNGDWKGGIWFAGVRQSLAASGPTPKQVPSTAR